MLDCYCVLEQQCLQCYLQWLLVVEWFLVLFWEQVYDFIVDVVVFVQYVGVGVVDMVVGVLLEVGWFGDVLFVGVVGEFWIVYLVVLVVYDVVVQFYVFEDFVQVEKQVVEQLGWWQLVEYQQCFVVLVVDVYCCVDLVDVVCVVCVEIGQGMQVQGIEFGVEGCQLFWGQFVVVVYCRVCRLVYRFSVRLLWVVLMQRWIGWLGLLYSVLLCRLCMQLLSRMQV